MPMINSGVKRTSMPLKENKSLHCWEPLFAAIAQQVEQFGVYVKLRQVETLDGDLGRILNHSIEVVDDIHDPSIPVFTLCHLFGHLVQFSESSRYKRLTDEVSFPPPALLPAAFWNEFRAFEHEAFRYGAALLFANGEVSEELLQRYAAYFEVDSALFREYITTGRRSSRQRYRQEIERHYKHGVFVPITPLAIPAIEIARLAGVDATIF